MKDHYSIDTLLLSLQRSLLGYVRPDLRAVLLRNGTEERRITLTFVLYHLPTAEDKDFYSELLLDFVSDFPTNSSIEIDERVIYSSNASHLLASENDVLAYLRSE